jgi:Flp pilus assembly pilin Flp
MVRFVVVSFLPSTHFSYAEASMFGKVFDRKFRTVSAQGMTEYIIIVSLVAIACITAVTVFGQKIARLFQAATQSLDAGTPITSAASQVSKVNTKFTLAKIGDAGS